MKNNQNFDLRSLLEKKGFLAEGKPAASKSKSSNIGGLFADILKELATDPEIREKRKKAQSQAARPNPAPEEAEDIAHKQFSRKDTENQRRRESAEASSRERQNRRNEERVQDLNRRKKDSEEARIRSELEKAEKELAEKRKNYHNIASLLRNKTTLRQAFVLSEIIARPPGLQ